MRRIYVAMAMISARRQQRIFSAPSSRSDLLMISELELGPTIFQLCTNFEGEAQTNNFGKA
jgi:hypothetical protein